ncbi:MAG: photosystem II S4 domain protein [Limnochordia bacterium]
MLDRESLLAPFAGEDREVAARVIDCAETAYRRNQPESGDFLDPRQQKVATEVLRYLNGFIFRLFGGYKGAERKRLTLIPDYLAPEDVPLPVAAFQIEGNFKFTEVSHRDYLGSIMALGLRREKFGDLIVIDGGCQVVAASEIGSVLCQQLQQVKGVPVRVEPIELEQLAVEPEHVKSIRATVASLRLDAVAAAGFGTSRSKMAREIKAERVKVNWETVANPARSVAQGDILSIRGRGRVVVEEIVGTTKKGRQSIILQRYR